jgi:hypothetical protein
MFPGIGVFDNVDLSVVLRTWRRAKGAMAASVPAAGLLAALMP